MGETKEARIYRLRWRGALVVLKFLTFRNDTLVQEPVNRQHDERQAELQGGKK